MRTRPWLSWAASRAPAFGAGVAREPPPSAAVRALFRRGAWVFGGCALVFGGCALVFGGCASQLREPAPLEVAPVGSPTSVLLAEARAQFGARPDRVAVARAEALYREAAKDEVHRVEALFGAVSAAAWLVEHSEDSATREALSKRAADSGSRCVQHAPESATCLYALALGLGVHAREHPRGALEALPRVVDALQRAAALEPRLDSAGPARVLALVLTRAPGWPLGPGDAEAAVEQAARAVALVPDHPPNALVLAEALIAADRREDAAPVLARVRSLLAARTQDPDFTDWSRQVEALEEKLR